MDPISAQRPKSKGLAQDNETGFKSNLDDQLAQAGGIEGAQANMAAALAVQSQAQPGQKPVELSQALAQLQAKGPGVERPGKELNARMQLADYAPMTARVSSSVNAGSTIAGLKPWDHDWVFEGNPNMAAHPDVKPLIGPSNTEVEMAELQEALGQFRQMAGKQTAANPMSPDAAQVSQNLRSRGDLEAAIAAQADPAERMHMAQVAGALAGNLGQQLKVMNGQILEESGDGPVPAGPTKSKVALLNGQLAGSSGLSGAEFMNTLSAVRPVQQNGGQTGSESGQQDQGNMGSGGFSSRPELRVIDGAKSSKGLYAGDDLLMSSPAAMHSLQPGAAAQPQQVVPMMQVAGHVVPGSMAQDQLAHDAIANVTNGIRNMTAQGGGEMRIRLKPENLGELHLRVVTQGNEIGIHIQATDDKAKKILQDSLGSLKDSLAAQNLTLGKVAIEVAKAGGGHEARNDSSNQHASQQHARGEQFSLGQNAGGNRNQREAQWNDPEGPAVAAKPLKSAAQASMATGNGSGARADDGRLDVMA